LKSWPASPLWESISLLRAGQRSFFGASAGEAISKFAFDLSMLREATRHVLGIEQLVIEFDIEDATASFDELSVQAEFLLNFCRQTGGSGLIISNDAIFNGELHGSSVLLSPWRLCIPAIIGQPFQGRGEGVKGFKAPC